jgi:nitroreductase
MSDKYEADFSQRDPLEGVDPLFYQRWSPRAFQQKPVSDADLQQVIEAARWSPSCYNEQPWLFITSTAQSHERFVNLLVEQNQIWARNAPVLGFIVAGKQFAKNGNDNFHALFDSGSAWMAMTLQARMLGLHTHGMGGINYAGVYREFDLDPEKVTVICGFAMGYADVPDNLPEGLRAMEQPSARKPVGEIWRSIG